MKTAEYAAIGLVGLAVWKAGSAYQDFTRFEDMSGAPTPGAPAVTPVNCMTVRQAERSAYNELAMASALALGGLYLWMR